VTRCALLKGVLLDGATPFFLSCGGIWPIANHHQRHSQTVRTEKPENVWQCAGGNPIKIQASSSADCVAQSVEKGSCPVERICPVCRASGRPGATWKLSWRHLIKPWSPTCRQPNVPSTLTLCKIGN
jgi:hypothetical protein